MATRPRWSVGIGLLGLAVSTAIWPVCAGGCGGGGWEARVEAFSLEAGYVAIPICSGFGHTITEWRVDLGGGKTDDGSPLHGARAFHDAHVSIEGTPPADGRLEIATLRGELGWLPLRRGEAIPAGDLLPRFGDPSAILLASLREAATGGHGAREVEFRLPIMLRWHPDGGATDTLQLTRLRVWGATSLTLDPYREAGR